MWLCFQAENETTASCKQAVRYSGNTTHLFSQIQQFDDAATLIIKQYRISDTGPVFTWYQIDTQY